MKIGQPQPTGYRRLVSNSTTAGTASTAEALNGVSIDNDPTPGTALIATSSNSASWSSNVSQIAVSSEGSIQTDAFQNDAFQIGGATVLQGPIVYFAAGSNITFSVTSNTLTIHGAASSSNTSGGSGGSVGSSTPTYLSIAKWSPR